MHIISPVLLLFTLFLHSLARNPLYVDSAPDHVRPYIIEHYAPAQSVAIGQQIYRFPVTGASSGGAFSLLSTSSPASSTLGVLPHHHQTHHENFFALKGRFQLWANKHNANVNATQARLLTQGDYGSVPRNTTHTFQILDPDTEMVGVIIPGGFESLFFFLADSNYTASTRTPYVPAASNNSAGGGSSGEIIQKLQEFDVYAELEFSPRIDLVNGSAPQGTGWHEKESSVPDVVGTPYFVAKDYGPKYLKRGEEGYQIVQPFVTGKTGGGEFTQGSITVSRRTSNTTVSKHTLANHTAFEVLEGALSLAIGSEDPAMLIMGDVAFMPGNTTFSYWSDVAFTKFMYVSAGSEGLDQILLSGAEAWGYPVFPTE